MPGRGYLANEHIASFVGYAPRFAAAARRCGGDRRARGAYHGGEVAAPVFSAISREALLYLNVRPERDRPELWPFESKPEEPELAPRPEQLAAVEPPRPKGPTPAGTVPDFAGRTAREAVALAAALRLEPLLSGNGSVLRQRPEPGSPMPPPGGRLELWLGSGGAG
ncbi:MAG: PASTA domain-containing protein [Holophagales bacterium]|nr:PASTA domain-containing protein [Holophagales bacterium]